MATDWDDTAVSVPGDVIETTADEAYLVVVRGNQAGKTYPVVAPEMMIGRAASADLRLDDEGVSRLHCKLRHHNGAIVLEDLDSRNGTYCNGERVVPNAPRTLSEGDRLQVGTTSVLRFTFVEQFSSETSRAGETPPHDPLTNTYSRRFFSEQLKVEVDTALERKMTLSLLLVHIDRFDELMGSYPAAADQITIDVADRIRTKLRETKDLIARIERGDFGLISRGTSPGDTFMLAERVRTATAGLTMPLGDRPVTLSLGVASIHELRIEGSNDFLLAAGTALSRARAQGGNRVVLCTQDLLQEQKTRSRV